jgi:hypothetical protein
MEKEFTEKISELKKLLKENNNDSYLFFEKLLADLDAGLIKDVIRSIIPAYSITQYAEFTNKEELLFDSIWGIANKLKEEFKLSI